MKLEQQDAIFYTISNARYFLGTVGLVNSLRLTGHNNEIVVLECGLTPSQRQLLTPHCTLFESPKISIANPTLFKPFLSLLNPKGIVVLIDSDMIVTRSLEPILSLAEQGEICAYADPEAERWFAQWQQLFALPCQPRHQTYVCAGFVAFSAAHWPDLLKHWWQACETISSHPTLYEGASNDLPSAQADQDALNALLMSEIPKEALAVQPPEEMRYWGRLQTVQVENLQTLECTYSRRAVKILHADGPTKPWETQAWQQGRVQYNAYVRLLRRLLVSSDVALRVSPQEPLWLRPGTVGQLSMLSLYILNKCKRFLTKGKLFTKRLLQHELSKPSTS